MIKNFVCRNLRKKWLKAHQLQLNALSRDTIRPSRLCRNASSPHTHITRSRFLLQNALNMKSESDAKLCVWISESNCANLHNFGWLLCRGFFIVFLSCFHSESKIKGIWRERWIFMTRASPAGFLNNTLGRRFVICMKLNADAQRPNAI